VGYQWRWELSRTEVIAGQPVEFRITSADVNHGFGIYDTNLRLVAQTQAMPGYTNTLRHTFDAEGTYRILCMEYCGLAHHNMVTEIKVVKLPGAKRG
jgi:cytochrome c oxidase subunit 2